jgi:hypothetical protein
MSLEGSAIWPIQEKIGRSKSVFIPPVASKVSDDAGLPASWWSAAYTEPQTLSAVSFTILVSGA